ncbi:MAG: hypothetical protein AABY33_03025 [Pseudomonadota bacterium]
MPKDSHTPPHHDSQSYSHKKTSSESLIWLEKAMGNACGETALWVAVITQAMMDALSRCKKSESIYSKQEAIRWLTGNSKDFNDVCLCAGMNPDYVRRKAKKIIASPRNWRAEAGKGSRYHERKKYREKQRTKAEKPENSTNSKAQIIMLPNLQNILKI